MFGCPILSQGLFAMHAGNVAPILGRNFLKPGWAWADSTSPEWVTRLFASFAKLTNVSVVSNRSGRQPGAFLFVRK
jgi:hypothetical protein